MQAQAKACRLDIVHPDITHANPGMVKKTDEEKEGQEFDDTIGKYTLPSLKCIRANNQQNRRHQNRINRHDDRSGSLSNPIHKPVMSTNYRTLYHSNTPQEISVSGILTANTIPADLRAASFSMPT